jgi:hypothetical protein
MMGSTDLSYCGGRCSWRPGDRLKTRAHLVSGPSPMGKKKAAFGA